jgi:outer membrane receptor protein involved in Fe transport
MHHRTFGFTVASAGLLLSSGAVHAASAPAITTLEDVVVTATKREEKLKDVAMSITAVVGEDLSRRAETGFVDFAAQVPGLSLETISAGANRVVLRGQNVGSVGATIATTVDDIPFFMSGAQSDGAFLSANVDTFDLSRIEVLRGPQGTLYGAAAEGGLIKYVTNAPDPTQYAARLLAGGAVVSGGDKAAYGKMMVNIPVFNNTGALRISGAKEALPGWIDNKWNHVADENHGLKHSLRASLLLNPFDDLSLRFTAFNQEISQRGSNQVNVVGAAADPAAPPANQFSPVDGLTHTEQWPAITHNRMEYYALSVDYNLPFARLLSSTSYGSISYSFTSGLQNANLIPGLTYGDYFGAVVYGQPIILAGHQEDFVKKFNQELRLSSKSGNTLFGHGFDWQIGGFFTRETTGLVQPYDARNLTTYEVLDPPIGGADIPGYYKETAFFGDMTYHFSEAFDVEVGARHTSTKQHSQVKLSCCVIYGPSTTYPAIYADETGNTWSVAPRWHITKDTLLYARVATGFRPGGPNLPTPTLPNPPSFTSDTTRNYELGFRTTIGERFTIDVAAFDIDWKDVQILGIVHSDSGDIGINGNSGSAKSKGLEWTFSWRATQGLTLEFLGAYTDAKLGDDAPGLGAYKGDELPFVPKLSATFNADYKWHAFGDFNGFAGGSFSYLGTRYTGFSPSVSVIEPHVKLPTYNTLKMQVGIDNGQYSVELYATNLTNERGMTAFANSGGYNQTGTAQFIQPRTIGFQLGAKF